MKPTKKVGILLLAAFLVLQAATTLMRLDVSGMQVLISLVAIGAAVFLFMDR